MKENDKAKPKTEVLIGLVKSFNFNDNIIAKQLEGHPKEGRIYRILKDPIEQDPNQYVYRVHLGDTPNAGHLDGIFLGDTLCGNYFDRWSFEIIEMTPENYLEHSITKADLKKMATWFETDHSDLDALIQAPVTVVSKPGPVAYDEATHGSEQEFAEFMDNMAGSFQKVIEFDKAFERMSNDLNSLIGDRPETALYLSEFVHDLAEHNDTYAEAFIQLSKTDEAFIGAVLSALRGNETMSREDLLHVMRCCLSELKRTYKNEN